MPPIRPLLLAFAMAAIALTTPMRSDARGLIRDAGIEYALNTLAQPLLIAAGLPASRTRVLIINDMSLNAFVIDNRTIFIHAGLFLKVKTADELQAVIAHEIAHIANGHFTRRRLNSQNARMAAIAGAIGAVALGAATGNPGVGAGVFAGTLGSAQRVFYSHTRAEEAAADKSGIRYLALAGIDPSALREVLSLFEGQELLVKQRQDPYALSHPLTRDRIRAVDQTIASIGPRTSDRAKAEYWFERAQGKLSAYMRSPGYTLTRVSPEDGSDAARVQRALAHFKKPDLAAARREMRLLMDALPDDAYIQELGGWMEIESGNAQPAIEAYKRATELAPREPLLLAGYGRALLALDTKAANAEALDVLKKARARDRYDPYLLRNLAIAYARSGDNAMASLSTAERYALSGEMEDADLHATRAAGALPVGSPGWARAQDIIRAAKDAKKRR